MQHLLQEWDICQTEKLLVILDEKRKQKQEIDEKLWLTQKDEYVAADFSFKSYIHCKVTN